eukprot:Gb_18868 [translate_table: standard]
MGGVLAGHPVHCLVPPPTQLHTIWHRTGTTKKKVVSPRWFVKILVNQTQGKDGRRISSFYLTIPWRREMVPTSRIDALVMDISVDSREQSLSPLIDLVRNGGFRHNTNYASSAWTSFSSGCVNRTHLEIQLLLCN